MGGMGLLKKRANPKAQQHSEEAEALLEDWSEALQARDAGAQGCTLQTPDFQSLSQLEFIENKLKSVREHLGSGSGLSSAFIELEAIALLMDQEDDWRGLSAPRLQALHKLLMAAWVTAARGLLQQPEALQEIPHFRFVLRKVLAEDTEGLSGAAVLQAIIDGHNEDALDTTEDEADAGSGTFLDFEQQCKVYVAQPGRAVPGQLGGDHYDLTIPERRQVHCKAESAPPSHSQQPGLASEDLQDDAEAVLDTLWRRHSVGERQGSLLALDDVALRPILLRTVSHLAPDHALRAEVEKEVGVGVGTDAWAAEINTAMTAAQAAGVPLPSLPTSAFRTADAQAGGADDATRGAQRSDSVFDLPSFDAGSVRDARGMGSAAVGGLLNEGSFALFATDGGDLNLNDNDDDDLLAGDGGGGNDASLQGYSAQVPNGGGVGGSGQARQSGEAQDASFTSTRITVMLPATTTTNTKPTSLPSLVLQTDAFGGGPDNEDGGLDFLLGDGGAAPATDLASPSPSGWMTMQRGGSAAQAAAGGADALQQGLQGETDEYGAGGDAGGDGYGGWLVGSEEGDGGVRVGEGLSEWGASVAVGTSVGGKRTASLISLQQPTKMARTS